MGKVISIINMKGGVGKTTLCIGIADYLSDAGCRILIIDADPQFNATQAMLDCYIKDENYYTKEIFQEKKTIYRLFIPQIDMSEYYNTPKWEDIIVPLKDNLDILCGDLNLVLANQTNDNRFVKRIRNFIEDNNLKEKYDYILIDCPPTITIYTDSALLASDYYLIPNCIDRYSMVGIDSLQKAVTNLIKEERIPLKCIGLVYTMIGTSIPKKQEDIRRSFESKDVVENIDVFSAVLTKNSSIQNGKSGTIPTKYKKSNEDIAAISRELLNKISAANNGEV